MSLRYRYAITSIRHYFTGDLIKIGISTIAAAVGIKLNELEYEAARWYDCFETNPTEIIRLFGAPSSFSAVGYYERVVKKISNNIYYI